MNSERILSAGMAVVVIAAVGFSASTLASSMSTDPSDAVDIQWDALPLGDDSEGNIESAAERIDEKYRDSGDGNADGQSGSGNADQRGSRSGDGAAHGQRGGESERNREFQGGQAGESNDRSGSADQNSRSDEPSSSGLAPTDWPRELLLLLALLLAVIALAYRYRERLRRAIGQQPEASKNAALAPAPQNDVERAWVELVQRAGVDRPRTRTPRDCARHAVETGFDKGHVERLRRTFEDVRYGTQPPTDEQARVARETLDRLTGERG